MRRFTFILLALVLAGCASRPDVQVAPSVVLSEPAPAALAPVVEPVPTPVSPDAVDTLLTRLDNRALVGQLIVVYRADNGFLLDHGFGGVLLFKSMLKEPAALRRDLDALQAAAPVPYLVALDQEGGSVSRLDAVPGWDDGTPGAEIMTGWSPAAVRREGERIGQALRDLGVNLNLAPVLDSARAWDGGQGWMGRRRRAFGADAEAIVPPARAFALGCADAGIACLSKHYPGYDVAENSDLEPAHSGAPLAAIIAAAAPFDSLASVTAGTMMSSIIYPPLGDEPAVLCPAAVAMARQSVGPDGVVMTDDLWGTALRAWQRPDLHILPAEYPDQDWLALAERAVRAGNDLLLVTYPAKAALMQELLAVRMAEDPVLAAMVRTAAERVLRLKQRLGLLGDGVPPGGESG